MITIRLSCHMLRTRPTHAFGRGLKYAITKQNVIEADSKDRTYAGIKITCEVGKISHREQYSFEGEDRLLCLTSGDGAVRC